jgi:hypothetical protein
MATELVRLNKARYLIRTGLTNDPQTQATSHRAAITVTNVAAAAIKRLKIPRFNLNDFGRNIMPGNRIYRTVPAEW